MNFIRTKIPEVILIEPKVFKDERGYFMESFRKELLDEFLGYSVNFCQDNESASGKGVLRGLHYQIGDFVQTKLVRVIQGSVLDVAVDIRKGSPTFGDYVGVILSAENKKQLLVPKGFAHGFVVLSDYAIFSYKVDAPYSYKNERGIAYDDSTLAIDWQLKKEQLILSIKDKKNPDLGRSDLFDYNINYYD